MDYGLVNCKSNFAATKQSVTDINQHKYVHSPVVGQYTYLHTSILLQELLLLVYPNRVRTNTVNAPTKTVLLSCRGTVSLVIQILFFKLTASLQRHPTQHTRAS
jgi:hypothetical protein